MKRNVQLVFVAVIVTVMVILLVSVQVDRMSILDTDAIHISKPVDGFVSPYGRVIYVTVTFDPQLTTVTGRPMCRAYQILMEGNSLDTPYVIISVSGQYLEERFTVVESFLLMTSGEYRLTAYFIVIDYIPPDLPERSITTSTTFTITDPQAPYKETVVTYDNTDGTEFYNFVNVTIVEEIVVTTTSEITIPGFSVITLLIIPIIIRRRKNHEKIC